MLHLHQVEGAAWLANHAGGMLWWDVRTGKTRTAITAARHLGYPLLVAAPEIARGVWQQEWEALGGDPAQVCLLFGKTNRKAEGKLGEARLIVVGWATLAAWAPFLKALPPHLTVFDESHEHLANPSAQRWRAGTTLADRSEAVWLLSGTPYRGSAMDIWAQLRVLGSRVPYEQADHFGNRHCYRRPNAFSKRGWEWSGLRDETALIAASPINRHRDLGELGSRRVTWLDGGKLDLSFDPSSGSDMAKARTRLCLFKARQVAELANSELTQNRPIVVFGWHHDFLNEASRLMSAPVIDGSTPQWRRQELLRLFSSKQLPLLICQMGAAGVGVDMAAAEHAIFGELDWNETTHRQAEGRLRGPRQKGHPTYHYLIVRHSVEQYVWEVRMNKGRAMDRLDAAAG